MTPRLIALSLAAASLCTVPLAAQEPEATRPVPASRTSVGADVGYTTFGDETAPWTLGAVSLRRQGAGGAIIGRVTLAERFGGSGVQYEADAYPRLGGTRYAYLNAGYSSAAIFPEWRYGAELFTGLPDAFEASLGVRHLRFPTEPVTLLTGSLGKYAGNYWVSVRPFVRAREQGLTGSGHLTARRYFASADEHVGLRLGFGTTPADPVTATDLARSSSASAGIHASRALTRATLGTAALGWERERLAPGRSRDRVELNAGVRVDF